MNSVDVKTKAKDLKVIASKYGYDIKHSHALEILSQLNNNTNWHVTSAQKEDNKSCIKTGLESLDKQLQGGLIRGGITAVLAEKNVGKSLFCLSLVCNALRANQKVLVFSLINDKKSVEERILSNLANIEYGKIIRNELNEDEIKKINDIKLHVFENRLIIKSDFSNYLIESISSDVFNIRTSFKFDLLFIDDYSTLTTTSNHPDPSFVISHQLHKISLAYDSVVLVSVTASSQIKYRQIIRCSDLAHHIALARTAAIILTLNMNDEERMSSKLRVYLEKQRFVSKDGVFSLKTNFFKCNLIN